MALRFTPTLAVWLIGAGITGALLALPATDSSGAAPATVAPSVGGSALVPAAATIEIADFSFAGSRTATAGAVVEVSNADGTAHTLTARDGAFDTGAVDAGTTVAFTAPAAPGTYDYFCAIHPSMTGSLVVN
jgi:plastocyanin